MTSFSSIHTSPSTGTYDFRQLVLASNNPKKCREITLPGIECVLQGTLGIPAAAETGDTFVQNALIKAQHASRHAKRPALADDSGLMIDTLEGAPGVHSARFAGPNATDQDNLQAVRARLANTPGRHLARYICVLALVRHASDPLPALFTGIWEGEIILTPKGSNGFGYDPIFYLPEQQQTVAELAPELKQSLSHRAKAIAQLKQFLNLKQFSN